ncbi:MAG TPA: hypothetical protein VEY51_10175 [Chondromyces sp.]|nr:hypothetical protein [Chondromyces sp.]
MTKGGEDTSDKRIYRKKALEFENMVNSVPFCKLDRGEREKTGDHGLNIICGKGVKIPSKINKWGMMWKKQTSLEIIFDFPVGLFIEEELSEATGLPLAQQNKCSYIKVILNGDKWDSVCIRLFSDRIDGYSFAAFPFQKMFHRIIFQSTKAED